MKGSSMENDVYLYPGSIEYARQRNEIALWRESWKANIACKKAIEEAIRRDFDGMHLNPDCADGVIAEYGFKRVNFVLANTIQEKANDGRFSGKNKAWAKMTSIPSDKEHNYTFAVDSHPAVLDGFVDEYREAYQALGLFDHAQCEADTNSLDFTGKVLVLSPNILKEECWRQADQLWYAHDGFGCSPNANGRSVRCTCLSDGEETRWNRHDFVGVLKDEFLPDWAQEKLAELTAPRQEQSEASQTGGMNMT